jgi:hypothetical protein
VRYGKIRIEEGGELAGDVSTLASGHAPQRQAEPRENSYEPVKQTTKAPVKA